MSNSIYSEPENTPETLYINYYGSSMSFGDLAHRITGHFGMEANLDMFDIEVERTQVRGCSCCNDNSDYELYLVITKRKEPCDDTIDRLVDSLCFVEGRD